MTTNVDEQDIATPETKALVKAGISKVISGATTLSDLFQAISSPPPQVFEKTPPAAVEFTDEELQAIAELPEVFASVKVSKDRALTKPELASMVRESRVINTVLNALKKRKEGSMRESLANHVDHVYVDHAGRETRYDRKGHVAPYETQNISVEGTGQKIQFFASGGKPTISIDTVERLHSEGVIDRKTYLKITKKPDTPRVLDESGMAQAIKDDVNLFFLLGNQATPGVPTTTLKVVKDS